MRNVVVVGSINVDRILQVPRLPLPGETLKMSALTLAAGGKGANQAVAAARSGAATSFVGAVGADAEGKMMRQTLTAEQIDGTQVAVRSEAVTGQAYILLQDSGQNSILINSGANGTVDAALVQQAAPTIAAADCVITEFETDLAAGLAAFQLARAHQVVTILNPAPAVAAVPADLLAATDLIVPNETESASLTGIAISDQASLAASAAYFHQRGVKAVVITLGERGSFVSYQGQQQLLPAQKVTAVDTTAAGDTFIGALAAELLPDFSNLVAALQYASHASALTVQQLGALPSIPTRAQIAAAGFTI